MLELHTVELYSYSLLSYVRLWVPISCLNVVKETLVFQNSLNFSFYLCFMFKRNIVFTTGWVVLLVLLIAFPSISNALLSSSFAWAMYSSFMRCSKN